MKSKIISAILLAVALILSGCDDHLTRPPLDEMTDETYWTSESNVESFAWGFYTSFFPGYGSGYTWGNFFSGETLNDDFAPTNPTAFTQQVPTSGGGWSFTNVRKANLFIDRVETVPMDDAAIEHWSGVARFFRAMSYHTLVRQFGDVPYYDQVLEDGDDELYKPRDSRTYVMDRVMEDFHYAADNVREDVGNEGLEVNRSVVLAFMSRAFLFEGTFLKYHDIDQNKAEEYLEAAKWAAEQVMESTRYSVAEDYKSLFNSVDLSGNPEIILYRKYESGVLTHSLHTYVNDGEPQTGASRDAIESYLAADGFPIGQSNVYQGDQDIEDVMAYRDPRLNETFVEEIRVRGEFPNYSTSGYATHKFLNEDIKDLSEGVGSSNTTDSPVMRYGEVLLNYAEAAAELGELTQDDLDRTVNLLRQRFPDDERLPDLEVSGDNAMVDGVAIDDPERDSDVSPIIWEIRRERRTELMMEGFRHDDLRRWKKLEYTDTEDNEGINRGAWIRLDDYDDINEDEVTITGDTEGYIIPATVTQRRFDNDRVYLAPLPLDQITLYNDNDAELTQNPGW